MSAPPTNSWFLLRGGKQYGPLTYDELKFLADHGEVNPDEDLIWINHQGEWRIAGEIGGLFAELPAQENPILATDVARARSDRRGMLSSEFELIETAGGMGRGAWMLAVLLLGVGAGSAITYGLPRLTLDAGERQIAAFGVMAVFLLGFWLVGVLRFQNLGMRGWWMLGYLVPGLGLWVGYRSFACPPGYAWRRRLDVAGFGLSVFYWLVAGAFVVVAVVAFLTISGMAGSESDREQIVTLWEKWKARPGMW